MLGVERQRWEPLDGDFYQEPDDICRGVSLAVEFNDGDDSCCCVKSHITAEHRFSCSDVPPSPLSDDFFDFTSTTLEVRTIASAHTIGNHLLDLLEMGEGCTAWVTKVTPQKFAIKAEVTIDHVTCVLKIRVYETKADTYVVEFQRRQGDCTCFISLYRLASRYLRRYFAEIEGGVDASHGMNCSLPVACAVTLMPALTLHITEPLSVF